MSLNIDSSVWSNILKECVAFNQLPSFYVVNDRMGLSLMQWVSFHSPNFLRWWFSFLSHSWTCAAVTHKDMVKAGGVLCCPPGTSELLTAVRAFGNGAVGGNMLFRRCSYCSLLAQREVGCYWLHSLKSESWIWKWVRSQLIRCLPV